MLQFKEWNFMLKNSLFIQNKGEKLECFVTIFIITLIASSFICAIGANRLETLPYPPAPRRAFKICAGQSQYRRNLP